MFKNSINDICSFCQKVEETYERLLFLCEKKQEYFWKIVAIFKIC